ncbi:hypothetical protein BC833DRAFT_564951 [Globomyces pollinis-pini]|nr:hypothetical protein BC833DRAFT_564951 [Globomyces pollinis-pini]
MSPWCHQNLTEIFSMSLIQRLFCQSCTSSTSDKLLGICSGCWTVYYCSSECQALDWRHHETFCTQMIQQNLMFPYMDKKITNWLIEDPTILVLLSRVHQKLALTTSDYVVIQVQNIPNSIHFKYLDFQINHFNSIDRGANLDKLLTPAGQDIQYALISIYDTQLNRMMSRFIGLFTDKPLSDQEDAVISSNLDYCLTKLALHEQLKMVNFNIKYHN